MPKQFTNSNSTIHKIRINPRNLNVFLYLFLFIAFVLINLAKSEQPSTCITCHIQEIDEDHTKMVEAYQDDVHAKRGVGCEGCHGGDPTAEEADEAMSEEAGYKGKPARHEIPALCAKCHADPSYMRGFNPNIPTDQYSKYLISGHGKRLTKSRDSKVAVCTSCHGTHGILAPNDPSSTVYSLNIPHTCAKCHSDSAYMSGRKIPTNQFELFAHSVHGEALLTRGDRAAPTCTGCHGSHEARRPDPSGVANTCAQCHNYNRELFVASPHKAAHEKNNYPECEVCHGNHAISKTSDDMLISDSLGVCQKCHDAGSKGLITAAAMKASIDSLKAMINTAKDVVEMARTYGMSSEEPEYQLRQAHNKLVQARALIHTFSSEKVTPATTEGLQLATEANNLGQELMNQYNFRRRGFVLSVVVILLLSIFLTLKIRSLK